MNEYASFSDVDYKWFFDDPKVSQNDLTQIRPLSKEYAAMLWTEYISSKHQHLAMHFVKGDAPWIDSLERLDYDWEDAWNANDVNGLGLLLNSRFEISDDEPILFFWDNASGVETTWGIFLRNWINFLYEDEAPVLFIRSKNIAVIFRPMGTILASEKT